MTGASQAVGEAGLHFDTNPAWLDILRAWAAAYPRISRVWIFGSRASGVRRIKDDADAVPDLDVAYEVRELPGAGESAYTYHFFRIDRWREALQAQLPVKLDLQYAATDDPDAYVPRFVAAASQLIYDATGATGVAAN